MSIVLSDIVTYMSNISSRSKSRLPSSGSAKVTTEDALLRVKAVGAKATADVANRAMNATIFMVDACVVVVEGRVN